MSRQQSVIKDRFTGNFKERSRIMAPIPESDNDTYVKTNPQIGLDKLAYEYYNDATMWWVIAHANGLTSNIVHDGRTIRIPANPQVTYIKE